MGNDRSRALARTGMAAAVATLVCIGPAAAGVISGTAEVVDGDGLMVGPVAIRIHGIDAPETGQRCNARDGGTWECDEAAANRLESLIGGGEVECEALDQDRYGRVVARCMAGETDLGATLVVEGLAWAFVRYADDYVGLEEVARADERGIWQAETPPPWEFRAGRWDHSATAAPADCPIKGNIGSGGDRIYHAPWSRWYDRTTIDESAGERWFCDEAEALAAGWRAPRR